MRNNKDMRQPPRKGTEQVINKPKNEPFIKKDLPYFVIEEIIKKR